MTVARRGYVYAAMYEVRTDSLIEKHAPVTCEPEEIVPWIDRPVVFVGMGYVAHRELFHAALNDQIIDAPEHTHFPSGRIVAHMAYRKIKRGARSGRRASCSRLFGSIYRRNQLEKKTKREVFLTG